MNKKFKIIKSGLINHYQCRICGLQYETQKEAEICYQTDLDYRDNASA